MNSTGTAAPSKIPCDSTGKAITISGDGQAQLSRLTARDVHAVVTGSGLIHVTATTSLDAAVPGDGSITYAGHPPQVTTSVTGTGSIARG